LQRRRHRSARGVRRRLRDSAGVRQERKGDLRRDRRLDARSQEATKLESFAWMRETRDRMGVDGESKLRERKATIVTGRRLADRESAKKGGERRLCLEM